MARAKRPWGDWCMVAYFAWLGKVRHGATRVTDKVWQ